MANTVAISIIVDSGQSVAAIEGVKASLISLGVTGEVALKKVSDGMNSVGAPGLRWSNSFKETASSLNSVSAPALRWSQSMDQVKTHTVTGLDSVRLLSQEFGLRLPRAIEAMLSRMPAVTNAIGGFVGALSGIAAGEVIFHVAEGAYTAYKNFVDLNTEADKFYETLKKTSLEDVGNTKSIETTQQRLNQASSNAASLPGIARTIQGGVLSNLAQGDAATAITLMLSANSVAKEGAVAQGQVLSLTKQDVDQKHAQALGQIELNHAMDSTLGKQGEIAAAARKARETSAEDRSYNRKLELSLGNSSPQNAGANEERIKNATADAEASAKSILLSRQERDARITMENEAVDAGLEGEKKWLAQRQQAIAVVVQKFHDGEISQQTEMAETAAVALKYDNERALQTAQQIRSSERAIQAARGAGTTGAARILAEQSNENNKINDDPNTDGRAKTNLREAAAITATQKLKELQDNFSDHVKALDAARLESSLNGFARIDAAAQKQVADLQKTYEQDFGNAALTDAQKLTAYNNLQAGLRSIDASSAAQKSQLAQRNAADDLQYDQEAARAEARVREDGILGWVVAYKNGVTEIQAQEAARLAKLNEDSLKEGLTYEETARRRSDIERQATAEIAQQNQQLQHQIAGNLQAAFTDPIGFIKSRMEQMFFEILAGWIMRMQIFKQLFGSTMGSLAPGAAGGAAGGGLAGSATAALAAATGGGVRNSSTLSIPGTRGIVGGSPNISTIYAPDSAASSSSGTGGGIISDANSGTLSQARVALGSGTASQGPAGITSSSTGARAPFNPTSAISDAGSAISTAQQAGVFGGVDTTGSAGGFSGSTSTSTVAAPGYADNGEAGGYAGYQTGDTDEMSMAAAQRQQDSVATDGSGMGAQASQQAAAANGGAASDASSLGKLAPAAMAGYQIEQSTVNAFESDSPLKGALGDAAAGASIGMLVGGPAGAAIGAAAGAALGAAAGVAGIVTGEGGKMMARSYYEKSVLPELESDYKGAAGVDFQTGIADANRTAASALSYMRSKYGADAANWVNDNYLHKELTRVTALIASSAEGGRFAVVSSASQFHTGGTIDGFGSYGTSSNEGFIHAMLGETVMNTQATASHGQMLAAMNAGASATDIASKYLAGSQPSSSGGGSTYNGGDLHVHTLDTKTMVGWLRGGGAQLIKKHTNDFNSQYAGDGISG